ncbi:hypothetical protein EMCRGX_G023887 [Ephydatia muelleri]
MSDKKETCLGRAFAAEDRCQRNGDYKGGSRKECVPRYHKQQYCPREKRSEQRRVKESTSERDEAVVHAVDGNSASSRKAKKHATTSLNHLLNFTISPRESSATLGALPSHARRRSQVQCYNKEQYLQANCQFVVSASGDYSGCYSDADLLVDWDKIEQVRLFCHQIPSCPICLYQPRAAQITRCGHVYCWSCLLHYLELSDKKWRKCPICYESIYKKDLKSVVALKSHQFNVGDVLRMKLMKRKKGTNCALPKSQWYQEEPGAPFAQETMDGHFLKLLHVTPSQVLTKIIQPERFELEAILSSLGNDDASEKPFVEKALTELKVREEMTLQIAGGQKSAAGSQPDGFDKATDTCSVHPHPLVDEFEKPFSSSEDETDSLSTSPDSPVQSCAQDVKNILLKPQLSTAESSTELVCNNPVELSEIQWNQGVLWQSPGGTTKAEIVETEIVRSISSPGDFVFFYQASDGQHLYLHPVNAKCMIRQYGSLENGPEEIEAQLVQMDQMSMTEEIRRRFRYLNHLPITCEFALCELALEPPTVSEATLDYYHDELHRRHLNRQRKEQEEMRLEKMRSAPSPGNMDVSEDGFLPLGPSCGYTAEESAPLLFDVTNRMERVLVEGQKDGLEAPSAFSFADALRCSSGKPQSWPAKHKVEPVSKGSASKKTSQGDQEMGDETSAVPSYRESFNSSLILSPELATRGSSGEEDKSKKKGRKKLVLFTTGGTRGN